MMQLVRSVLSDPIYNMVGAFIVSIVGAFIYDVVRKAYSESSDARKIKKINRMLSFAARVIIMLRDGSLQHYYTRLHISIIFIIIYNFINLIMLLVFDIRESVLGIIKPDRDLYFAKINDIEIYSFSLYVIFTLMLLIIIRKQINVKLFVRNPDVFFEKIATQMSSLTTSRNEVVLNDIGAALQELRLKLPKRDDLNSLIKIKERSNGIGII